MNADDVMYLYSFYILGMSLCPESEETLTAVHTDISGDDTFIRGALSK